MEIGHVLFIDIVGYSKLLTNEQREKLEELNRVVRETEQVRSADANGKLLRLPTGDGMVLVFFTSPDAPARCAVAIARALRNSNLPLRMGIHSGPVDKISHVDDRPNLAGAGVNVAQRVMNCGDAGHILLSKRSADDLAQHAEWKAQLHDLGEVEVKHGVRIGVVNLCTEEAGNPNLPQTLRRQRRRKRDRLLLGVGSIALLLIALTIGLLVRQRQTKMAAQAAAEAAAQRQKSVAILPFENLSSAEQNAVFAGGVHREVLSNLAKLADLKVISRTSVMRYKPGGDRNVKQIAQELGVNYLVEGSVQREGGKVHVTAELIDARTDSNVWSETYDGDAGDVIGIQTEIAQRISNQLGAKLSPRESSDLATKPTQDLAAFESYIRARALMETPDMGDNVDEFRNDNVRAVQLLEQAVARDSQFVAAYWALAEANIQVYRCSNAEAPEYRARSEAALKQAQRLAPDAGETIYAQSRLIYYGYHDFKKALATLEQAANLLPNNAEISLTRALLYRRFGRWQESFDQFVRATELNPQDRFAYINGAAVALELRWYEDADRILERALRLFPGIAKPLRMQKIITLRLRGDVESAQKEFERLNPDLHADFLPLFYTAFWNRNYEEARRIVNEGAKFPDLDRERWEGEARLAKFGHGLADKTAALEAEKRLEQQLKSSSLGEDEGRVTETLSCVKLVLGKKEEAIRLCEASVAKHPVSEDALININTVRWLAYTYVFAGDRERSIQAFARLVHIPAGFWYGPLKFDPLFDDLRKDPRFDEILKESQKPFPRQPVTYAFVYRHNRVARLGHYHFR